ncbi:MAG: hypothetical protein HY738_04405 [Bacteroidia bacterium]|nr:hypothetical protein [Bacteroidia bacterium]
MVLSSIIIVCKGQIPQWTIYNSSNSNLPSNVIHGITIESDGTKWFCTSNGLVKYNGANWSIYNMSNTGLPTNDINTIIIDDFGIKWIGTNGKGLVKNEGSNWSIYNQTNSLIGNVVRSIAIDTMKNSNRSRYLND